MKWQELFATDPDGDLMLIGDELEPESREHALSLSILKWEAMVAMDLVEDGGYDTCGMCVLHNCQSHACYNLCGVDCLDDGSTFLTWQDEPTAENARAVLYQLKTMYLEEFGDAESTD